MPNANEVLLHRLWVRVRQPFLIPESICSHGDWEIYDMHMGGCRKCGIMHLCQHDTCPLSLNYEGQSICNITGLCTKMLSFSDLEFVQPLYETSSEYQTRSKKGHRVSRKKRFKYIALNRPPASERRATEWLEIDDVVASHVNEVLCSEQWTSSSQMEYERYIYKWSSSSTKVLRDFKRSNPGLLPIIPDMYTTTLSTMGSTRIPSSMCLEDRQIVAQWCSQNIRHHLMMLQCNFPDIVQANRTKGMVVGLMYLMRGGIIVKGIVVLPRLDILHSILPLETHLLHIFGIKGKVITETENLVKQVLKSLSPNELVVYGTPQNHNPLSSHN
jgi:hypothetical protein